MVLFLFFLSFLVRGVDEGSAVNERAHYGGRWRRRGAGGRGLGDVEAEVSFRQ